MSKLIKEGARDCVLGRLAGFKVLDRRTTEGAWVRLLVVARTAFLSPIQRHLDDRRQLLDPLVGITLLPAGVHAVAAAVRLRRLEHTGHADAGLLTGQLVGVSLALKGAGLSAALPHELFV
ncbi:hypothetical protein NKK48_01785 [Mesorhizobium sp. C386A]|uniref:hypothetical protein n=1 Tax=unclassified Mesorhizobium TaxID=325217 RepID=UPI0012EC6E7C|nr:hypothetical protein [Mesorhizobium sp. LNJC386A00]